MSRWNTKIICVLAVVILFIITLLSISIGSKHIPLSQVITTLFHLQEANFESAVVIERIPRTAFGILAGAALAVSGCIMQSITRNPIADPSILGVNTGASLAVVAGIAFFSISNPQQYIWLAFFGAFVTSIFVYGISSAGYGGVTPIKLALAGAATSTALGSLVNTIMLPNSQVMDQFRFWQTGSIGGANWDMIITVLPYLIIGFIMAFSMAGQLDLLALGDEVVIGLGANVKKTRLMSAFAGVLLCGATTALAGPIGFIGLMVPHFIRSLLNVNMKVLLPLSAIVGSSLLLFSDIIGRIAARPAELEVGIVTAILGAPIFIWIVRKVKVKIS